jgi:phosphoribosylanthranilate isomerase
MRTRVKICGITRRQDAEFAIEMGADALGLVFYAASPRAVTIAQAVDICQGLPPFVSLVGLFVNPQAAEVQATLEQLPLSLLQFHGDETATFCQQFHQPYMKAVRMQEPADLEHAVQSHPQASALLLDSFKAGVPGGTGQTFDWSMISPVDKPVILAGGLTVDNVSSAIQQIRPYGVDVSGGVESAKGIKNNEKIRAFMQEVANA